MFYGGRLKILQKDSRIHPSKDSSMIRVKPIIQPKEYTKEKNHPRFSFSGRSGFSDFLKVQPRKHPVIPDNATPETSSKREIIVIHHVEEKWNLEEHGGIKMWVNSGSGEVSLTNPYQTTPNPAPPPRKRKMALIDPQWDLALRRESVLVTYKTKGTAFPSSSLEVQELFDLLDPKSKLKLLLMTH